jgi:hypothetical protein
VLRQAPAFRRFVGIELTLDGRPEPPEVFAKLVRDGVIIRITDLAPEPALEQALEHKGS